MQLWFQSVKKATLTQNKPFSKVLAFCGHSSAFSLDYSFILLFYHWSYGNRNHKLSRIGQENLSHNMHVWHHIRRFAFQPRKVYCTVLYCTLNITLYLSNLLMCVTFLLYLDNVRWLLWRICLTCLDVIIWKRQRCLLLIEVYIVRLHAVFVQFILVFAVIISNT